MADTILTRSEITREAARVLHAQLGFVSNCNVQYDDQFANVGAKIGNTLNVRLPAKYKARKTATLSDQDHVERSTPFALTSQYGVDVSFSSVDLTLSLDDFSERVITPAMSQLASEIEGDCFVDAVAAVANYVGTTSTQLNFKRLQEAGAYITRGLGPRAMRCAQLTPGSMVEFNDDVKGVFQSAQNIANQYREGVMGEDVTLTGGAGDVVVKPAVIYGSGNAYQNCALTGANTDNLTVTAFGVASTAYGQDLFHHRDAFIFGTADLEDVSGRGAAGAREVVDGISMRMAEQYNITNDAFVTRFDVLFGFDPLYPELATRHFFAL